MSSRHAHCDQRNREYRAKYGKPGQDHNRMCRADRNSVMAAVCPLTPRVTEFVEHFRPASLYEPAPIVG